MKFNAKQIKHGEQQGKWAVFEGNTSFWVSTVRDTKDEVLPLAASRSAVWHMDQAKELLAQVDGTAEVSDMHDIAVTATQIRDEIVDWNERNWEDHDDMDPLGFTC